MPDEQDVGHPYRHEPSTVARRLGEMAITRELLWHNGTEVGLEDAGPGVRAVMTFRP